MKLSRSSSHPGSCRRSAAARIARTATATLAVAATTLAIAGCHTKSSSGSGSGSGGDNVTIMVGGLDKIIYLPAQLTESLGYFSDAGVNVKLLTQPSGASAENQLLAGQVQAVVGFYDHTQVMQAKGKCLESVVQFANVPGEAEMVAADQADTIKSAADFKGKKAGVTSPGSSTDFLTQYFTAKAGVTTKDYSTITAGAGQTFISAMQKGGIDAGMTTDPTITTLLQKKAGSMLFDMRTEAGTRKALGGLYPASSLYLSCDYVRQNPQTVQKLANAFVKTLGYIHDHSAAEIAAKMPEDMKGGNDKLYVEAMKSSKGMFTTDGKMDAGGAKNVNKVLSFANPDMKGATVDIAKTYTTEFVDKAE
jgi:NitT/TauT family transport system substrate-binding protein